MIDPRSDEHLLIQSSEIVLVSAGRPTGKPQEDTLRFAYAGGVVYLLARPDADAGWYQNLEADRGVVVRVKRRGFRGRARLYPAKQRAQAVNQIVVMLRNKYGAAALAVLGDQDGAALQPVTIEVQF